MDNTYSIIKALSAAAGSVSRFAEEIGYSRTSVHAWLNGTSVPSEEARRAIAERYGLSSSDFADPRIAHDAIDIATGDALSPADYGESPEGYRLLDDEGKRKVRDYVRDLLDAQCYRARL